MYAQHRLLSAIKGHMRGISTPGNSQANSICSVHDGSKFMYQDVCHKIPTHYGDATFPNVLFRRSDKDLGRVTPATEQLTQSSAHCQCLRFQLIKFRKKRFQHISHDYRYLLLEDRTTYIGESHWEKINTYNGPGKI